MVRAAAVIAAAVLWLVPAGAAPAPKDKPDRYFPTAVGTTWVYGCGGEEDTRVVTATDVRGGATVVSTARRLSGGRLKPDEVMAVSADGLDLLATGPETYDPPVRRLRLPVRPGVAWTVESTGPDFGLRGKATAHGPEKVRVPAGEFTAVRVHFEYTFNGQVKIQEQWWYAVGVGLVKSAVRHDDRPPIETVLKSFKPGKD